VAGWGEGLLNLVTVGKLGTDREQYIQMEAKVRGRRVASFFFFSKGAP
jgi:hypothetical protein